MTEGKRKAEKGEASVIAFGPGVPPWACQAGAETLWLATKGRWMPANWRIDSTAWFAWMPWG